MIFERILGIAACDSRGVMGREGKLPWHCPEELEHFSSTILDHPLIMGYRTFLSLPKHYFEGKRTIVFSRQRSLSNNQTSFVSSLEQFFAIEGSFKDLYVVGGGEIYRLFLEENLIEEFILTTMKNLYDGDTFFPLSLLNRWDNHLIRKTQLFSIHRYKRSS